MSLLSSILCSAKLAHWLRRVISGALLLTLWSCTTAQSPDLELTMQVASAERPGVYQVSGSTNLPDRTQITVQGIRYLTSAAQSSSTSEPPNYSILARQVAEVQNGRWQTTLSLWQVAPDGRYQEAWQQSQPQTESRLQPSPTVTFLAVTDPSNRSQRLKQPLDDRGKNLAGEGVRFTTDGQWYAQASQTISASLPTGTTAPPALEKVSDRRVDPAEPVSPLNPDLRQTTVPLSVDAYFR
ncbi:hypothetical protein H6F43_20265 [Leptolyngbya sp. FACHB-36]|uniref:hypothetical protein n=1 Tax=Leptolyngbya sp. FACHB-36 TaxID=2692808 RepID=UPI0016819F4E|nr:hypothetical protein [Leptolyngbya sp. FACHB-36]MBD2022519.1 hypothetical protein [Leptolyngbya sp. FACHB-36]